MRPFSLVALLSRLPISANLQAMRFLLALLLCFTMATAPLAARAAEPDLAVIRDAEIEAYLATITRPIFEAAGVPPDNVRIVLVNSPELNAFVAGGMNIFIYTGLLLAADDPLQVVGVVAHETGHIAGGHLVRGREAMQNASTQALLATIIGVAAGIAAGSPQAGTAIIGGGQQAALTGFLSFSRQQESAADNAGMSFLDRANLSASGLLAFFGKLEDQELLPAERQSQYMRTHPLTQDRVESLRQHLENSPLKNKPAPAAWVEMHKRMEAKLLGFMDPMRALQTYKATDTSFAAQYGRAIALFKRSQLLAALPIVDQLIAREPNNPYLYELKGQMLFESSRVKEALVPYARALQLAPDAALIELSYAHAMVESGDDTKLPDAINHLQNAQRREPKSALIWRLLATAWGRQEAKTGDQGLSSYALAEEAAIKGDVKLAEFQIGRAERSLPQGSPYRLKLIDLKDQVKQIKRDQADKD